MGGLLGPKGLLWLGVGTLTFLAGCRTATVATQNLDAVLGSSDRFEYTAATTGVWTDLVSSSVGALKSLGRSRAVAPEEKAVPNPSKVALKNLIELATSDEGPEDWLHNEQVRLFTRYATSAPSQLCRERAVLELVPHAQRLGVTEPYEMLEDAANQSELRQVLEGLVDATRRIVAERGQVSDTARADFDAAVSVLEATRLNVAGGSRLLRAIGPFFKGSGLPSEQKNQLAELSLKVQKDIVREALYAGIVDRSDIVRSAGMTSNIAVYGEDFAIEALLSLVPRQSVADPVAEAFDRFGVMPVPIEFDETLMAVCNAFARAGLPFAAKKPTALGVETRGTLLATLWQISINDLAFSDRARHAAMRALNTMSGSQLDTLRSEEWDTWFRGVAPALEKELETLKRAEAEAATNA